MASTTFPSCFHYACRLIETAYQHGHKITITLDSKESQQQLNDLLWEFRGDSFIPHVLIGDESIEVPSAGNNGKILLNLTTDDYLAKDKYQRLLQIVPNDPSVKKQARELYRQYQSMGHSIETHQIKEKQHG